MIIGQDKLINKINNYNIDNFPKSLILVGPEGSGKHTIIDYIAKHLNLPYIDLTEYVSYETLTNLSSRTEPYIYVFDANKLSIKDENVILKFIEEPLKNTFVIIACINESQLIDTVLSRCQIWRLDKYKIEQLDKFSSFKLDSSIMHILDTPGKLLKFTNYNEILAINELVKKIFTCIKNANIQNVLTLSNKISFNNEEDKFDFNLFIDFLLNEAMNYFISNPFEYNKAWLIYKRTYELSNSRFIAHINKKQLFENYILDLKLLFNLE